MGDNNWIIENLRKALDMWNNKLGEIWALMSQSPESFKGGAVWDVMADINGALKAIGYGLLVLFFVMGVMKTVSRLKTLHPFCLGGSGNHLLHGYLTDGLRNRARGDIHHYVIFRPHAGYGHGPPTDGDRRDNQRRLLGEHSSLDRDALGQPFYLGAVPGHDTDGIWPLL